MSIIRDTSVTFFTRIAFFILQGISALILARALGPEGRGIFALLVIVPTIAATFSNLGLHTSTAFHLRHKEIPRSNIINIFTFSPLLVGLFVIIPIFYFSDLYISVYKDVPLSLFQWGFITIPCIALFNNVLAFYQGEKRFDYFNSFHISNPLVYLSFLLFFFLSSKFDLKVAIYSWQLSFFLPVFIAIIMIWYINRPRLYYSFAHFRTMSRYGIKVASAELLTFLNYRLDIFLVGYFLDASAVGWYAIAVVVAEILWFLASSVASVTFPSFTERDQKQAVLLLVKSFQVVFWSTVTMLFVLLFIDKFVILLAFGDEFLPSLAPLRFLYPGILMLSLSKVLSSFISARGRPDVTMKIAMVGVLFNLFFNLWFIPKFGITGAALSSSIAYIVMFIIGFFWTKMKNYISFISFFRFSKKDFFEIISKLLKSKIDEK